MDLMKRGPGKLVARPPAQPETMIESREPPILNEPVSLDARRLSHKVQRGPEWNYPRPALAARYPGDDDDLPPRAA
jgi:hypothetical protein